MKYIKTYEDISTQIDPQPGDYILASNYTFPDQNWENYIKSNIGELMRTNGRVYDTKYILTPEIIKDSLSHDFHSKELIQTNLYNEEKYIIMKFVREKITNFSDNIEELLPLIQANKFNL